MKNTIAHIHEMCEDWHRELEFYKVEICYLYKRLAEVASKNTVQDVLVQIEHFENKFKIMSIHVDELLHNVKLKNESILKEASEKPNFIHVKMIESDETLIDLMHDTSKDFYQTKKEYYQFLSKVM